MHYLQKLKPSEKIDLNLLLKLFLTNSTFYEVIIQWLLKESCYESQRKSNKAEKRY